ncbi:MAG: hypothetical protein OXF50_11840 [Caldilineaceae bacterium]|nr:hypothetical protein [Caldilineaceae bacterium]
MVVLIYYTKNTLSTSMTGLPIAHRHSYPREKQEQYRRAWSGTAGAARFGRAWQVSARAGAKRHMPNLHTARPHLQSYNLAAHLQQLGRSASLCARKGNNKRLEGRMLSRRFLFAYV